MAIRERFGYNVNDLSFRGAGAMFEALASNAAGKGKAAAQQRDIALSEYSKYMSSFNKNFSQSQSTTQAAQGMLRNARATENQAAGTMNKSRQIENAGRAALQSSAQNLNKIMASHGINDAKFAAAYGALSAKNFTAGVNGLFQAGKVFASFTEQASLKEGTLDGDKLKAELVKVQDPATRLEAIEKLWVKSKESGTTYDRAVWAKVSPLYVPTVQEADIGRQNTLIGSAVDQAMLNLDESGDKYDIGVNNFVQYAKDNNLNMGSLNVALYSSMSNRAAKEIIEAQSIENLQAITAKWAGVRDKNFNDNNFIKSKSPTMVNTIAKSDRVIKNAITATMKMFKAQGQSQMVAIMKDPLNTTPDMLEGTLNSMQLDPLQRQAKVESFVKAAEEASVDYGFRSQFMATESSGDYWNFISKETKHEAEVHIGNIGAGAFLSNDNEALNNILEAHPGHVTEIGTNINNAFYRGNSTEKQRVYDSLMFTKSQPGTSRALSQVMGDKEFTYILTMGTYARMMGSGEKGWDSAEKLLSGTTGDPINKLSYNTDKDLAEKIDKASNKLGSNGGRFKNVMQTIYSINPQIANDRLDTILTHFENLQEESTYVYGGHEYNIVEDFSNAPDSFKAVLPPSMIEESKAKFIVQAAKNYTDTYGYAPDYTSMSFVGDSVILKDGWMGTESIVPTAEFLQSEKKAHLIEENLKAEAHKKRIQKVMDISTKESIREFLGMDEYNRGPVSDTDVVVDSIMNTFLDVLPFGDNMEGGK